MRNLDDDDDEVLDAFIAENKGKYYAPKLTTSKVDEILQDCFYDGTGDPFTGVITVNLKQEKLGWSKSEVGTPVSFSKAKVEAHKKDIKYLLGQLQTIHDNTSCYALKDAFLREDGVNWTEKESYILKLMYLAIAARFGDEPIKTKSGIIGATLFTDMLIPTVTPGTARFDAWWAEHQAEWQK